MTSVVLNNGGVPTYANLASFPANASDGALSVALDTDSLYEFDGNTQTWVLIGPSTGGGGSVTSVSLALPSIFSISGSPITTSGTLTGTFTSQTQKQVFAAPNGSSGIPSFRALLASDIPNIAESQVTNLVSDLAGKQPTGNYLTALTGDGTATGPGSAALTLATVNSNVGSFGSASSVSAFTVNAKGLVTTASNISIQITESQVTNLVSDLASKQPIGSYITALTGPVTATGPGSVVSSITNNAITNTMLAQAPSLTLKGNNTGATANELDLTSAQAIQVLNPIISSTRTDSFTLLNQTLNPVALSQLSNVVTYTGLGGKLYAIVTGLTPATITIYDVTNPANPFIVSSMANLAGAYNVSIATISGQIYAFVPSNGTSTLYIVNISNPYLPTITTMYTFPFSGTAFDCVYNAGYVYVAHQRFGLVVVDVGGGASGGTLLAPVLSYRESVVTNAIRSPGVAISNGTLYTTQYTTSVFTIRQFKSWNISTPQTPTLIQSLQVTTVGQPLGITISGNTAVVAVAATGVNTYDLIDITTPSAMTNLSQVSAPSGFSLGSTFKGAIQGNYFFAPWGNNATLGGQIQMFDITNRSSPISVSSVNTNVPTSAFGNIAISNGYIYAGDYGIAPGSSGNLDIFTMPLLKIVAGNITTSTLTVTGGIPGAYYVNNFTLSSTDITNKFVTLSSAPVNPIKTAMTVVGGPMQDYGTDYSISSTTLTWSGTFLDGVLIAGDKLVVQLS
jgi:hypothetical protein